MLYTTVLAPYVLTVLLIGYLKVGYYTSVLAPHVFYRLLKVWSSHHKYIVGFTTVLAPHVLTVLLRGYLG